MKDHSRNSFEASATALSSSKVLGTNGSNSGPRSLANCGKKLESKSAIESKLANNHTLVMAQESECHEALCSLLAPQKYHP